MKINDIPLVSRTVMELTKEVDVAAKKFKLEPASKDQRPADYQAVEMKEVFITSTSNSYSTTTKDTDENKNVDMSSESTIPKQHFRFIL